MIIDGKKIAQQILEELRPRIAALPIKPLFCDVVVGSDPVQLSYVHIKGKMAESIGCTFSLEQHNIDTSTAALMSRIQYLNSLPSIAGLIVQLPLPGTIDTIAVLNAVSPEIDVDCLTAVNSKAFYAAQAHLTPPTAAAVMTLLDSLNAPLADKQFVVVGQGTLVGKPVAALLAARGYTCAVADKETTNLEELLAHADVIITGAGQPGLITGQHIQAGAIVIDAGTSESDGGISGDVDFDSAAAKASFITPVPGGVGPVTVAELLRNVVVVAEKKFGTQ